MGTEQNLFEQIGGKPYLQKVAKRFYDKLYAHPWLKNYFKNTRQEIIESQQVDFMTGALGGPRVYSGRMPADAHPHMMITPELFDVREQLLIETLKEESAPPELIDRWMKIEHAFKRQIIKASPDQCKKRWATDEILDFPNPNPHGSGGRKVS
jgi:truncated hemoglobin YjbI